MNARDGLSPHKPVRRWAWNPVVLGAALLVACVALLASCKSTDFGQKGSASATIDEDYARRKQDYLARLEQSDQERAAQPELDAALESKFGPETPDAAAGTGQKAQIYPGTGEFIKPVKRPEMAKSVGEITLNFENTDIREVVKVILSDMLGKNYILDPRVKGGVTMQTGTPLSLNALLPTLETLLRMNGSALVDVAGTFHVVPLINAIKGRLSPQIGADSRALPEGYSVLVVPLKYISVLEMSKILAPFAPEGSIIRADSLRNILLLAGTSPELETLVETIHIFDVDWMEGLSVAFFPLEYASLEEITVDLNVVFGDQAEGPLAGMLRLVPIESANGLLVVTPQKKYLNEVKLWIERFDRLGGGLSGAIERLFVYRVRNGQAADLAELLTNIFTAKQESAVKQPRLAPGATPVRIGANTQAGSKTPATATPRRETRTRSTGAGRLSSEVQFVADEKNNFLLVMATPTDYEMILQALKELDVTPLQVLVEVTIIEVELNDELKYGIRWSLTTGTFNGSNKNQTFGKDGQLVPGGFSWSLITSGGNVKAVMSAFAGEGLLRVLSAPSVMVLDNHTARIQVGDEVPIATSQSTGTDTTSTIVNNIEYRDTGVLLEVTPRVNPGGLVTMEISQEVSRALETKSSALDSPTIATRRVDTTVAVNNNQTVVLGGLIRNNTSETRGGVPGLYKLPFIGNMFGDTSNSALRTELVVILTPKVISGDKDITAVTEDFRNRLWGLEGQF